LPIFSFPIALPFLPTFQFPLNLQFSEDIHSWTGSKQTDSKNSYDAGFGDVWDRTSTLPLGAPIARLESLDELEV